MRARRPPPRPPRIFLYRRFATDHRQSELAQSPQKYIQNHCRRHGRSNALTELFCLAHGRVTSLALCDSVAGNYGQCRRPNRLGPCNTAILAIPESEHFRQQAIQQESICLLDLLHNAARRKRPAALPDINMLWHLCEVFRPAVEYLNFIIDKSYTKYYRLI